MTAELAASYRALARYNFNHQTHHRGQLTAPLSQVGRDYGVTDLIALLRTEA